MTKRDRGQAKENSFTPIDLVDLQGSHQANPEGANTVTALSVANDDVLLDLQASLNSKGERLYDGIFKFKGYVSKEKEQVQGFLTNSNKDERAHSKVRDTGAVCSVPKQASPQTRHQVLHLCQCLFQSSWFMREVGVHIRYF